MREIEFRAKTSFDKSWVYGVPVKSRINCGNWDIEMVENIEYESDLDFDTYVQSEKVDPETIGQYTGLLDNNGTKIFEGDILKLKELNYNYEWTAVVEFGNPNSEYVWGWNLKPITKYIGWSLDILCWVEMPVGSSCEVIGNIFDSPELLEEK